MDFEFEITAPHITKLSGNKVMMSVLNFQGPESALLLSVFWVELVILEKA